MNILFVHQNFPAQFYLLASAVAQSPAHRVVAMGFDQAEARLIVPGVDYRSCGVQPAIDLQASPWMRGFDQQVRMGMAAAQVARQLRGEGFVPDVIVGHSGWGETLFLNDVWPGARLVVYQEYFQRPENNPIRFLTGRLPEQAAEQARVQNSAILHALAAADVIWCPTEWQRGLLPRGAAERAVVVHDGIDTESMAPAPTVPAAETITFVNRAFEPLRGFHVFMRVLPRILRERPLAHAVLVGGDGEGYGLVAPPGGRTWREYLLAEVGSRLDLTRVHFVGKVSRGQYRQILQASTLHVYLTGPFVVSWSMLEAMSVGCRLLASRTAPVEEFVRDGENGVLCDFSSPDDLAAKAIAMLADPARFDPLRVAARETVVRRCDARTVCLPKLLALLGP